MNKGLNRLLLVLICFNLAFIWGNSLLDGKKSNAVSDRVVEVVEKVVEMVVKPKPSAENPTQKKLDLSFFVRKSAHIIEFLLLAVWLTLISSGRGKLRFPLILFAGMSSALIDETIQLFTGRTSSVIDVWIDLMGFATGILLTAGISALLRVRRGRQKAVKNPRVRQ